MATIDFTYRNLLEEILKHGYTYEDPNRKGVTRTELTNYTFEHSFVSGFPIISLKSTYYKGAINELLVFLSGSTDITSFWDKGIRFWDKDFCNKHNYSVEDLQNFYARYKKGDLHWDKSMGPIYPHQWRKGEVDQIKTLIETMKVNPLSTSLIVESWNPQQLSKMCLPPCHKSFQVVCFPFEDGYGFDIHWSQRSTDVFLGTPINIVFYAALALILEKLTGHKALGLQGDLKNVHLYDNQIEEARKLCTLPAWELSKTDVEIVGDVTNFEDLAFEDFLVTGYNPLATVKVEMLQRDL